MTARRKRSASIELVEPPAKKCPTRGNVQDLEVMNSHHIEDFTIGEGLHKSNKSSIGVNEKGDRGYGTASKRKLDAMDNDVQFGGPSQKSGKIAASSALFLHFSDGPSTSKKSLSSFLEMEEEESQWQKEGAKAVKAVVSSDWGDKVKEFEYKQRGGLKDFGVGMTVRMANLIVSDRDRQKRTESNACNPSVVNYKKFRKVKPVGSEVALPVIIGESDLVPFKGGVMDF